VIAEGSLRDRLEKPTMVRTIGQLQCCQCNVREDEHRPTCGGSSTAQRLTKSIK